MYNRFYIANYEEVERELERVPLLRPSEKGMKDFDYTAKFINKVNQIVRFDNFFEGLDQDIFNFIKITDGMVGVLKDEEGFECCRVMPAGLPRKDGRPYKLIATYIRVKNGKPEVVVTNEIENDKDIVLFYNTSNGLPDFNIVWLAKMLGETDVSIYKNILFARYAPLLRVKSEKEKQQLTEAINKIVEGKISTLVSDDLFEDILSKEQDPVLNITDVANSDKIQYLSHLYQDIIKRFSMEYGCPISGVEKMAQQNNAEINGDVAYSWLTPIDMLNQAKEGCKRAKALWEDLTIEAHFGTLHELMYLKFAQDITKDNPDMNVSIEENQNIEDLEVSELYSNNEETDPGAPETEDNIISEEVEDTKNEKQDISEEAEVDENINSEESIEQDSGKSEESIEDEEASEEVTTEETEETSEETKEAPIVEISEEQIEEIAEAVADKLEEEPEKEEEGDKEDEED